MSEATTKTALIAVGVALVTGVLSFGLGIHWSNSEKQKFEAVAATEAQRNIDRINSMREQSCTEEAAERNLKSWMDFNYPDWPIHGDITTIVITDCVYNLRFDTMDPRLSKFGVGNREVIIAQLDYQADYSTFTIRMIRGFLY